MNTIPQRNMSSYANVALESEINVEKIVSYISHNMAWGYHDFFEKHDFWEMVYLENGDGIASTESEEISLHTGDVYFHKPGEAHCFHTAMNKACHVYFISFYSSSKEMKLFEGLKFSLNHHQKNTLNKLESEGQKIFETIYKEERKDFSFRCLKDNPPFGGLHLFKIHLETLLLSIARIKIENYESKKGESKESLEAELAEEITEILAENVYSNFNIESLCGKLNYSRTYLSTVYKKHKGLSIMSYYNFLKIQEAKQLIRDTEFPFNKIAEMLKFNNQYYFSRVFKKFEGISPSEYKNKINSF